MRPMPYTPVERAGHSCDGDWRYWCLACAGDGEPDLTAQKHITDAECAAEKWRALSSAMFLNWAPLDMLGVEIPADGQLYSVTRPDPTEAEIEAATWHRFATHPHADEENTP